jgi:hypothetical protein
MEKMTRKVNPLNLNALQLKTLTLLQVLARLPDHAMKAEDPDEIIVTHIPQPHGDHFHVGARVVRTRDASGLTVEGAWKALERKGLIKSMFPTAALMTAAGLAYDTGLDKEILHGADH